MAMHNFYNGAKPFSSIVEFQNLYGFPKYWMNLVYFVHSLVTMFHPVYYWDWTDMRNLGISRRYF